MRALFLHSKHHLPLKHALQEKAMLLSSEQKLREQISETVSLFSGILRHFVALTLCALGAQETKTRIRLANRDAIEEALRKELRELKKSMEETKSSHSEERLQMIVADEKLKMSESHKTLMDAAQSQIASLNSEIASLRSQPSGYDKLVEENKMLNEAVAELDKAFSESEKRVILSPIVLF